MEDSNTVYPEILKRNSLKVTQPRLKVLEIISRKESAISQPELEKLLGKDMTVSHYTGYWQL